MEDHRLKSYCLVVETKSFSRAAQARHMTQSAMSRLVKGLEDELGVTLLHRKGKNVAPTSEGLLFYEHAKKILEDYAGMERDINAAARTAKDTLRLGVSRVPAVHLLPQVLYDFSKAHPGIRIDLAVCEADCALRDLREGKTDAALVGGTGVDRAFSADVVAADEVVVIAPENHPLAKKKAVTVQELIAEQFILPARDSETRTLADGFLRDAGFDARKVKVRMTVDSPELIVRMVQAGSGLAFASKWSVFTAVKEGTVKLLKVPGKKMSCRVYLVRVDRGADPDAVDAFRNFIREYHFFIPF
jgi:DNA-binding transcriptional LysR family regulator